MSLTFIIPYRNRRTHLATFLPYYRKRFPEAKFIVVEQAGDYLFNRAKLMNIGFLLAEADYYVFHDVDMLVQGTPDYSCPDTPTHLATNCSQFNWAMPFPEYFGGAVLFNRLSFIKANGYSNNFWGWGGEDNEMYNNLIAKGFMVARREHRYFSLPHPRSHPTGFDADKMEQAKIPRDDHHNGLKNCTYKLLRIEEIINGKIITVEV